MHQMRILGSHKQTPWERFIVLQHTLSRITRRPRVASGIIKFHSYDDKEQWSHQHKIP
jgi:hypothetical protein